jgi:CubicO group peptidase (beta-lactamase class C family)
MAEATTMRKSAVLLMAAITALIASAPVMAADTSAIESNLAITVDGGVKQVSLGEALALLNIPSVSIALIDQGQIAFAGACGENATPDTLYQAASLSKFVAAIGTMRLVEQGKLNLDQDVNDALSSARSEQSLRCDPQGTLRGLLSMTGGIGVPGFLGYRVGAPIPTLTQVLDGVPPANSAPITVPAVPGRAYHYSGGGYEIAEALMQDATDKPFAQSMQALVLAPAGMSDSSFEQPLDPRLEAKGERPFRRRNGASRPLARLPRTRRRRALVDGDGPRQAARRVNQ